LKIRVVKIGQKLGIQSVWIWPLTKSILVFWPLTTVQSFIKYDSKLRPQER